MTFVYLAGPNYSSEWRDYARERLSGKRILDANSPFDCDIYIANFLGATKISIETLLWFGVAYAYRKYIITIMEQEGNLHDHAAIKKMSDFCVDTLDHALDLAIAISIESKSVSQ